MKLSDDSVALSTFGPYLKVEEYGRDKSGKGPRFRLELRGAPPEVVEEALAYKVYCATCLSPINAFRRRKKSISSVYVAVACPLESCIGCSRGDAPTEEYHRIRKAVLRRWPKNLKKAVSSAKKKRAAR